MDPRLSKLLNSIIWVISVILSCELYLNICFADVYKLYGTFHGAVPFSLLTNPSSLSSNTAVWFWHPSRGIICGWSSTALLIPESNHCEKPDQRFQSVRVFWKYCVVKCHLPFLRFNLTTVLTCFHLAGWQCSMSSWCSRTNGFRLFVFWGAFCPDCGLEDAQKRQWILMGCVRLFRAGEGCGPVTRQMDNADSPGALACNIFLLNWKVFANSSGPIWWPPFLLTFSLCHINTQEISPPPLNISCCSLEWTGALSVPSQAWAINYKQPCQRPKRNDCRKPARWMEAKSPLFVFLFFLVQNDSIFQQEINRLL